MFDNKGGGKEVLTRSHRLFSIAIVEFGLIASHSVQIRPVSTLIIIAATGIGSSLPDIDEYNSTASRNSPINFSLFLHHRGITHSLLGLILFAGLLYFLMNHFIPLKIDFNPLPDYWTSIWCGLVIGYLLHLIEDSFSKQGVAWLAPFFKRPHRFFITYKVNGLFEKSIASAAYLSIILMSLYWLWLLIVPVPKI